jgi:DNA transposition AAA+ family ATPase
MNMNDLPNKALPAGVVPIASLDLVSVTLEKLLNRHANMAGLGVLYGPPGRGKSMAAGAMVSQYRAYYIQVRRVWSVKVVLQKILLEMGVAEPKGTPTTAALLDMVTTQLSKSNRPLILDEADYLIRTDSLIETVRDIYEGSRKPVLLVGTDDLRTGLRKWKQMHSRVYAWEEALPVSLEDAAKLATVYAAGVSVAPDLLAEIVARVDGSVRYTCVNLSRIRDEALVMGEDEMTLAKWGDRAIYTDDSEGGQ